MWGEISPQWHLLHHHLSNLGPSYLNAERLEELLIVNRPKRPGEDVKDSISYSGMVGVVNVQKMSFKTWALLQDLRVLWMRMKRVNRILQVVCRDEIAMGITYKQAKETDAHKDDRATKRRRKDVPHANTKA